MANYEVGSVWRKWDLHIHSPASYLNNQFRGLDGEDVWESYIKTIEQTDLSVIAVTDYFSVDGYRKLREEKNANGRLSNIDLILPNIELRLNVLDRKGKRVNFHVIFSDKVCPDDIEDHFLHELHFTREGRPQNTDIDQKIKKRNLEELGREYIEKNPGKMSGMSALEIGATLAVVDHSEVSKLLKNRFENQYVLVLADDQLPSWNTSGHEIRKVLTQKADFIFTSFPADIKWYLGQHKDYTNPEQFRIEFKSLKPCIHGSDAHELFFIGYPCSERGTPGHNCKESIEECNLRYCWIKADTTFEGLRQVLYEPAERVFIGAEILEPPRSSYSISAITFSEAFVDKELTVGATAVPINQRLVAVTGGKGAGKTAFVDLIANCFMDRVSVDNENSFVWRICKDHKPPLRTSINFIGAETFEKDVFDSSSLLNHVDVAYIEQGQLDADVAKTYKLTERIEQLVLSTASKSDKYEFDSLLQQISDIQEQIGVISERIIQLSTDISVEVQADLHTKKKTLEISIDDLANQITKHSLSSDEIELAQKATDLVASLESRFEKLKKVRSCIEQAQSFLSKDLAEFNDTVLTINRLVQELEFEVSDLSELAYPSAESIDRIADRVEIEIKSTLELIDKNSTDLDEQNKRVADHSKVIDEKRIAEDALNKIKIKLSEIESTERTIQDLRVSRVSNYRIMLDKVILRKQTFQRMMTSFLDKRAQDSDQSDSNRSNILTGLDFSARIRFSRQSFLRECRKLFDGRKIKLGDDESYFDATVELLEGFARENDGAVGELSKNMESLADDSHLTDSFVSGRSISDFYELLYGNHFVLAPEVSYKNVPIDRLSIGQKATVLIKLYLADGTRPIIIDSHDDHLDNKFIYDELIPAITEAKKSRQIILVSNNANVVVNADAEQVIIAEHHDGTISYVAGSLENPDIRDKAIDVLEGGEIAFRERRLKYRIT